MSQWAQEQACGRMDVWGSGRAALCRIGCIASLALLLSGCAAGPAYHRPQIDAPVVFRGQEAASSASLADLPWWDVFKDDTLKEMIRTALTNNYDMRIAASRIKQAHAVAIQAQSAFFPQIGYEADATRGKNAILGRAAPGQGTGNAFLADLNAAWELDFWGSIRRLDEAAQAEYFASEEARRGVALSLVAGVAQAYFELLELDRLMEIAQNSTNSFSESLQVFDERLKGGVASKLETARAEAALATVAATIPSLERDILLKENQINVLLGRNPGPIARSSSLLKQTTPPDVPAGLPSALLERRPDVREAEQRVRSANAQVGAAVANFFPQVNLTGLGGKISSDLSKLGTGQAGVWAGEAQITGPLFQGGRMYGVYRQTQAAWEEAALSYKQSALTAFREVADALIARDKLEGIQRQQARSVEAYREAVKVSLQRYQAGRAAYYEVLEAQQQLFPAENALAQTQLDQLLAVVQLYKVLGGGWSPNDDNDHSQ